MQQGQLEIDLNFIARAHLWKIHSMHSIKIGSYQAQDIPILNYHDLIGGKLAALFARHKSRDLFDIYTIFSQPTQLDLIKTKLAFIIYGASARMDLRKINLNQLDFDPNELKNMLLPLLRHQTLQTTKNVREWATTLINHCKDSLKEIIVFNLNEQQFLHHLLEEGEIKPEFITDDQALINLIHKHPILQWKAKHVKKFKY